MSNAITFDGSNYPLCDGELSNLTRNLAEEHANDQEFSIDVMGISKEYAIQFGLLHSLGRQALFVPIRDDNQQIIGWTLQFVKYSA